MYLLELLQEHKLSKECKPKSLKLKQELQIAYFWKKHL
jgi:hypothetical protein